MLISQQQTWEQIYRGKWRSPTDSHWIRICSPAINNHLPTGTGMGRQRTFCAPDQEVSNALQKFWFLMCFINIDCISWCLPVYDFFTIDRQAPLRFSTSIWKCLQITLQRCRRILLKTTNTLLYIPFALQRRYMSAIIWCLPAAIKRNTCKKGRLLNLYIHTMV